jgi:hypothetical protein
MVRGYAEYRATNLRTHGAINVTVGNATGQVVAQLLVHCDRNSPPSPCVVASTKAETIATMIAERRAPKATGAYRAGMRMSGSSEN